MTEFLQSIGYGQWILHALIVLPLVGVVPVLLGDERSAPSGWRSESRMLEFLLSVGLWWALEPGQAGAAAGLGHALDPELGHQLPGRASTASRSSWCC